VRPGAPLAFARLAYPEAEEAARSGAVLILPIGSTEPHGPHLPLDTDVVIVEAMAGRAAERLRAEGVEAYVLPPIAYAVTEFGRGFGGAISVSAPTAAALLEEILSAFAAQGFSRIAVASAHLEPAHLGSIRDACARVKDVTGVEVIFPDLTTRRWASMLTEEFKSGACHAGRFETSIVMARRPEDVREEVRATLPPNPVSLSRKIREGVTDFRSAGGDRAYFGDPAAATAEEGASTIETLAEILVTAVREAGRTTP
jgi:creatinine amidohydrolase